MAFDLCIVAIVLLIKMQIIDGFSLSLKYCIEHVDQSLIKYLLQC